MKEAITIALVSTALAIVGLSTSVSVCSVFRQWRSGKPKDRTYEDADGRATPRALAAFSNKLAKAVVLLLAAIGTGTGIGVLVLSTAETQQIQHERLLESSLYTAAWGLILVQAVCLTVQHSPIKSHNFGVLLAVSACLVAVSSVPPLIHLTTRINKDVTVILRFTGTGAAVTLGIASSMLPRRPDVLCNGNKVDRQWTVSFLNRLTWTWIQPLLRHASLHNDIDFGGIPHADSRLRSHELKKKWDRLGEKSSLLFSILTAYKGRLAILWTASLIRCTMSILPFWFMLLVLDILENNTTRSNPVELFTLIVGMAASNLLDSWMEGWAYWYSMSDIALPIRSQMSVLIFEKALRRKTIRGGNSEDSPIDSGADGEASTPNAVVLKSHQAIVNLVGIDTERLSYFFQFHFLILNGVVKLVIFSAFLLHLLGWIPLLAGIFAWALTLPANTWFSGKVLVESQSLMRHRDAKLSKINEVLLGMRQIKFSALESQWERRILALRETELKTLWKFFLVDSGLFACWMVSPILLAVASLVAYVLVNGSLLPSVAFVSIGILNNLEITLGSLPELLTLALDSLVSLRRIDAYLKEPERQETLADGCSIAFEGASISWPVDGRAAQQTRFTLGGLTLSFPRGVLSVISGKVGTGKTLLISAILGEADLLSGSIRVLKSQSPNDNVMGSDKWVIPGSVAYISQTPWLENGSLRNNVLFGLPFDKVRYSKVVEACALGEDLAALPDGDGTELGANGVNLSGGQKWRVTLARAVYSRAETLLMEDIFSAVDSRVGAWIFDRCLAGDLCRGRTRILVTHHVKLVLPEVRFVVELGESGLEYSGPPRAPGENGRQGSSRSDVRAPESEVADKPTSKMRLDTVISESTEPLESLSPAPRKFVQEEIRQRGTVKGILYLTYVTCSGGLHIWAVCFGVYLAYQAGIIGRAWWLRIWTGEANVDAFNMRFLGHPTHYSRFATQKLLSQTINHNPIQTDASFYIKVYISISLCTALIGILRFILSYMLAIRASRTLFKKMLSSVIHAPLRWLDTVPTGRILNRFTADFSVIDERIAMTWTLFLSNLLRIMGICVASCFASVYLIPPAILLLGTALIAGSKYLIVSRPLKRLESNAKSPVFELFNTTLTGILTIRAFRMTHVYLVQMHSNLDAWAITTFYISLANRWMSFRIALIAALFSIAVGVVIIVSPIDAALAGLALSFILDFSDSLRWMIRCYGDMELEMNAMERAVEYMSLETEPLGGLNPPAVWPTSGRIEFKNLEVRYAPDLPPALNGLSLKIEHGERIGVVGRTGAGKSSLTLALFRFLEARSGSIAIDGLDISKLNLADLRSRMSIIPQHPVLFSGTLRSNLDPFGKYTDMQLHEALSRVHLVGPESADNFNHSANDVNIFRNLSSPVSESGGNLSKGQQQLTCIAHALLADSKIIILDEATSAVDVATDTLIQRSIRDWFTDRTLIVVAHRLSTISDFDRILVLDNGRMVEFDTPRNLWEKKGIFRSMCDNAGEMEALRRSIVG